MSRLLPIYELYAKAQQEFDTANGQRPHSGDRWERRGGGTGSVKISANKDKVRAIKKSRRQVQKASRRNNR